MGTSDPLRVGLAGLGRFGKLHAAVLGNAPGVTLAAVCDPQEYEVAAVASRFPAAARFTSVERMIDDTPLDALFVVTPEPLHAEQALAALARGIPVFVEKPLATSAEEGERIAAAAFSAGVPLQVGFVLRFDVQHLQIKAAIERGDLGQVVSIRTKRNCSRSWFPDFGDRAHTMYETAIHDVDLLLWYAASPVVRVTAVERNLSGMRYPDGCWAIVEFANGMVGTVETSWLVPAGAPANVVTPTWRGTIDAELEVVGTAGAARVRLLDSPLAFWHDQYTAVPEVSLWPEVGGAIAGALREEDHHFLHRVRTGAPESVASVGDAVAGLRVIEAIVTSARNQAPVELGAAARA